MVKKPCLIAISTFLFTIVRDFVSFFFSCEIFCRFDQIVRSRSSARCRNLYSSYEKKNLKVITILILLMQIMPSTLQRRD